MVKKLLVTVVAVAVVVAGGAGEPVLDRLRYLAMGSETEGDRVLHEVVIGVR